MFVLPAMISALRNKQGLNQSQLAERLGVSPSAVNQVENTAKGLQEGVFMRYATALGYASETEAIREGVALLEPRPASAPVELASAPATEVVAKARMRRTRSGSKTKVASARKGRGAPGSKRGAGR